MRTIDISSIEARCALPAGSLCWREAAQFAGPVALKTMTPREWARRRQLHFDALSALAADDDAPQARPVRSLSATERRIAETNGMSDVEWLSFVDEAERRLDACAGMAAYWKLRGWKGRHAADAAFADLADDTGT